MKNCLTIAGSDCSGGAGIQADLKTFSSLGTYGMSVITSVVAENTCGVISSFDIPVNMIDDQINAVFEDIRVDAVKIGMMSTSRVMGAVAEALEKFMPSKVVVDPVMLAKDGCELMQLKAVETLKEKIIPITFLLTPNIPEAQMITGIKIKTIDDMKSAAQQIYKMGAKNVLIKGGHYNGDPIDLLFAGDEFYSFNGRRINTKNTHGTGCTLSSAIAANLAKDNDIYDAVKLSKIYISKAIENSLEIGKGSGPLNHFYNFKF